MLIFHTPIVTAAWVSLLDGFLQMDKTALLESVEVLSLNRMRGCFHARCPLGCSLLPPIPLTKGVVHSSVVSSGIRCPHGRVLPTRLEGSPNNAKSFLLSPMSSIFPSEYIKVWGEAFLECLIRCSPGNTTQCITIKDLSHLTFALWKLSTLCESVV